jgi:predicted alpha/beta-hydrolase family hydrolase
MAPVTTLAVETPHGPAKVHLRAADSARGALVLGHGAAGGVTAPDLVAATEAAGAQRISVALVEQPYRVAGRRSPAPARQLDAAWLAVVEHLLAGELRGLAPVVGGRSAGARVACRTAAATGAVAVLCLAFPLRPPRGSNPRSRLDELDAVDVPVLVVQGAGDPFGMPPPGERRTVVSVAGNHSLRSDPGAVRAAVAARGRGRGAPRLRAQAASARAISAPATRTSGPSAVTSATTPLRPSGRSICEPGGWGATTSRKTSVSSGSNALPAPSRIAATAACCGAADA